MVHLLVILLNAVQVISWNWIIVLLPEIVVLTYLMVGITGMLIRDYETEREKKKGMDHQ